MEELFMVALFADGEGNGQAISLGRKRAGGVGRVGARRIFEGVEIEKERAGLVEALVGVGGVKNNGRRRRWWRCWWCREE
jgi:hypothetical protein